MLLPVPVLWVMVLDSDWVAVPVEVAVAKVEFFCLVPVVVLEKVVLMVLVLVAVMGSVILLMVIFFLVLAL